MQVPQCIPKDTMGCVDKDMSQMRHEGHAGRSLAQVENGYLQSCTASYALNIK